MYVHIPHDLIPAVLQLKDVCANKEINQQMCLAGQIQGVLCLIIGFASFEAQLHAHHLNLPGEDCSSLDMLLSMAC